MKIAVLAVQGAFIEHERKLEVLGASCVELRKAEDLNQSYDGLGSSRRRKYGTGEAFTGAWDV